jgi:membrane protease YdiL (CAAX protease family)
MLKSERILGNIYLPLHIFALPSLLIFLIPLLFRNSEAAATANINLIWYVVSFLFILIFLFRYLKTSFSDLLDHVLNALKVIVLAYLFNYAVSMLLSTVLSFLLEEAANPNTREIISQTKLNANTMIVIAVLLAPVVEETLFRGALFGTIRTKSRAAAYIVSVLIFSVYHLWQPLIFSFDWSLLLYLLQYVPASIALCWCYEKSGSIWAPIVLHAVINFIQIKIVIG